MNRFVRLNTGALMPRLGLGTFAPSGDRLETAVDCALHLGCRHIDAANSYKTESQIGQVIEDYIKAGKLKRKDLFLTTKVAPVYLAPRDIKPCLEESLESLKTSYVDLALVHSPFSLQNRGDGNFYPRDSEGNLEVAQHDLVDIWRVFEGCSQQGLTRAIGVSNFTAKQMNRIIKEGKVKPSNLQLECHAYLQQQELRDYCKARDIVVTGYSPIGAPDRPAKYRQDDDPVLLEDPFVKDIADRMKKTPAQILLRYLLQLDVVPIPKSSNPARVEENFKVFDFELDADATEKLALLGKRQMKYFKFKWFAHHFEFPAEGEAF